MDNCGPNPERPGLDAGGTETDPIPVAALTEIFRRFPE
jgi:hypothetical protein